MRFSMPDKHHVPSPGYLPQRYVVAALAFLGMIMNFMLRINIDLAIVAMVKGNTSDSADDVDHNECRYQADNDTTLNEYVSILYQLEYTRQK